MCASCLAFIPCSASSTLGQFSLFFFVLPTCAVLTLRFVSHHLLMKTHCFALWPMAQPHIGAKLFSRPYSPICNFFLTCLDLPIFHLCGFSRPDFDTPTAPKLRKNVKHQRRWLRGSQGSSKSPNVHHTWAPPPKKYTRRWWRCWHFRNLCRQTGMAPLFYSAPAAGLWHRTCDKAARLLATACAPLSASFSSLLRMQGAVRASCCLGWDVKWQLPIADEGRDVLCGSEEAGGEKNKSISERCSDKLLVVSQYLCW